MTHPRRASAILFAAGVLLCTFSDAPAPPPPAPVDGYYILAADFHVHTAFGDGGLAPWDARREAQRRGIDVIAVTNHNQTFAARLQRRFGDAAALPLALIGQEVTAPHHHIIAAGITGTVAWDQSAADAIDDIRRRGGISIAAHPAEDSAAGYDTSALARLDGAEIAHGDTTRDEDGAREFAAFFERARRANPRVAPIGNSDFHFTGRIGLSRTYLLARDASEAGVLEAVRHGRSVAYDKEGHASGEAAFVEIVERARKAREAPRGSGWRPVGNAVGVSMAWLGLAGLVMLSPTPPRRA